MKTSLVIGALLAIGGMVGIAAYAEPTGALAVIAGMFPLILIRS